jgi:hypothetical protein
VSLITIEYIYLEELASGISLDVSYSRITVLNVSNCSRFILDIVSCGLLAHYRLSEDANPHAALAGVGTITYMLGEMRFLEALYRIGHVARILLFLLCSYAYWVPFIDCVPSGSLHCYHHAHAYGDGGPP